MPSLSNLLEEDKTIDISPKNPIAKGRTELIEHLLTGRVSRHDSFFDGHALQTSKRR